MFRHRRLLWLAVGALFFVGTLSSGLRLTKASETFLPFEPRPLPQTALGDFDGDGRPDVAVIDDGVAGQTFSVRLSSSSHAVYLLAGVASLVGGDVDHDGDIDLVATSPSGKC